MLPTKLLHIATHNTTLSKYFFPFVKVLTSYPCIDFRNNFNFLDHSAPLNALDGNRKILVCGLPKSGNTWLAALFGQYFDVPLIHPFFDVRLPGIALNHFPLRVDYRFRNDIVRCAYIVRDVRDVICSYYHYASTSYHMTHVNAHYKNYASIRDFYDNYFLKIIAPRYEWLTNARQYLEKDVPFIRYEDLVQDTPRVFSNLLGQLNIPVDSSRVEAAVEALDFKRLKKQGLKIDPAKSSLDSIPVTHFRSGVAGGWKNELDGPLVDDIQARFSACLADFGYDV